MNNFLEAYISNALSVNSLIVFMPFLLKKSKSKFLLDSMKLHTNFEKFLSNCLQGLYSSNLDPENDLGGHQRITRKN